MAGSEHRRTPQNRRGSGVKNLMANGVDPMVGKATQFAPGVSGNPGGRPGTKPITDAIIQLLNLRPECSKARKKYRSRLQQLAGKLLELGLRGNVEAIKVVLDQVQGKPRQAVDISHQFDFLAGRTSEQKLFFAVNGR